MSKPSSPRNHLLRSACAALLATAGVVSLSFPAVAEPLAATAQVSTLLTKQVPSDLQRFYASRSNKPLWVKRDALDPAAHALLELVRTAQYDGLDPATLNADALAAAIQRAEAERSPEALAQAELALSSALAAYVQGTRQAADADMLYEHDALRPFAPPAGSVLQEAATAGSLAQYVRDMQWMNPLYAPLRHALASGGPAASEGVLLRNLARIRAIPAQPAERYILVDTASARLWMYEGDRPVDSMKVVVGKPDMQTPLMSGYIRYAIYNPYWNIPADLVGNRIAQNVLNQGLGYLKRGRYEVVSDWSPDAEVLDPKSIDWRAVANGKLQVHMRQLPGGANAMGNVKFEFPNPLGIYLHDTPDRDLLLEDARQFSSGCIRLEDAERLGQWLMRGAPASETDRPEQKVDLPRPVPIYVTYLTARPEGDRIAFGPDPYGRDEVSGRAMALAAN